MIFRKILVRMSSLAKAIPQTILPKAKYWSAFSLGCSLMILASCTTTRTIPLESLRHDTLYINKATYDSIYIDTSNSLEYHLNPLNRLNSLNPDTVVITKTKTEYRFSLLRDTIRIAKRDSIPYEVRITEVKEVPKPPNLFDKLCKYTFFLLLGILTIWLFRKFKLLNF